MRNLKNDLAELIEDTGETEGLHVSLLRYIEELESKCVALRRENPKPLTLDELREMIDSEEDDNAIWVKPYGGNYYIRALLDRVEERGIVAIWHGGADQSDFYVEVDYGKTWQAYRTKPEGSGK